MIGDSYKSVSNYLLAYSNYKHALSILGKLEKTYLKEKIVIKVKLLDL